MPDEVTLHGLSLPLGFLPLPAMILSSNYDVIVVVLFFAFRMFLFLVSINIGFWDRLAG